MKKAVALLRRWSKSNGVQRFAEVRGVIETVFSGRVQVRTATSHTLVVSVPELKDVDANFEWGHFNIVVKNGQYVKPKYIKIALRAAELLGLAE